MKFHIVCDGESLKQIAFLYGLGEEELKKENKHIRVWNNLIPGTKLKIPIIPETIDQDISSMEPFVEDYYPKLKINDNFPEEMVPTEPTIEEYHDVEILSTKPQNEENITLEQQPVNDEVKNTTPTNPELEKAQEEKEDNDQEETDTPTQPQSAMSPYYFVPYILYPRYVYPNNQRYVYPVYVYPKWW